MTTTICSDDDDDDGSDDDHDGDDYEGGDDDDSDDDNGSNETMMVTVVTMTITIYLCMGKWLCPMCRASGQRSTRWLASAEQFDERQEISHNSVFTELPNTVVTIASHSPM
jgi:rubredoxin